MNRGADVSTKIRCGNTPLLLAIRDSNSGIGGVCRSDGGFVNSELLASRLRGIGHETFAEYYRELSDHSRSNEALIEVLIADKGVYAQIRPHPSIRRAGHHPRWTWP